jgi:glycosyltransferase involved in cell wall biosynthesis
MIRVDIGIHLHSEPERLSATLAHLRAASAMSVRLVLLPDGPDIAMRGALESYRDLTWSATDEPRGAAACFNRLLRLSEAPMVVFLEAGSLVGPSWLERLIAALHADPQNGLAGPSTNRSWNAQAAYPDAAETDIAGIAAAAAAEFGDAWQPLDRLHCLGDFCYAVRREVIAAIGGADEGYGAGPCWEMDYTVRAARAGFRAVWAQGAFVYRRPFTRRRALDEARLFEANKRRYQDKLCGLRLNGERTAYAAHCRGEACAHFAPADRIRLTVPLDQPPAPAPEGLAASAGAPLVSCIMPTRNRGDWVHQAVTYFQRQDLAEAELIIVDDGAQPVAGLPDDPRIRHVRLNRRLSIGAKRNRACALARGRVIVHWDDDDWYAPGRLTAQVAPLLDGSADITALGGPSFFDLDRWEFWTCTPELQRQLFVREVHGGTLAYRREVFEKMARFPDASLAEDAAFLNAAVARGARLTAIPADGLFLYLRHGGNAWAFTCGRHLDPCGWHRIVEPPELGPDRAFYAARSPNALAAAVAGSAAESLPRRAPDLPLVSCIMPTHNRRAFVAKAIEYFLRQDYPARELVVLDDGDDKVADLVPAGPSVRYVALPERLRLGAKRNAAIEASRGEIIVHWDDDDWMDPCRISAQVSALRAQEADICGLSKVWFCEIASGRLSRYCYPATQRRWLYGASLCYRRSLWQQKPFEPVDIGEDTRFIWASPVGRMVDLDEARIMVSIVHAANTSRPRPLVGPNWQPGRERAAPEVLGDDWAFYAGLPREAQ